MKAAPTLGLDSGHSTNWNCDASPVAILNEASTLHERVAYCWGIANDIQGMAELFTLQRDNTDLARVCGVFMNQMRPLVAMLEHMGSSTSESEDQTGGES